MKHILYDWFGLNSYLFKIANENFGGEEFHYIIMLLADWGGFYDPHHTLFFFLCITCISLFFAKDDSELLLNRTKLWIKFYVSVFIAELVCLGFIFLLKHYFAYPRPFCANLGFLVQASHNVVEKVPCMQSFPSGHTAFVSTILVSIWPILNFIGRIAGIGFLFIVMLSRLAAGVHFPADLFWSLIICVTITYFIRKYLVKTLLEKSLYKSKFLNGIKLRKSN
jgi:signal peptidase II